MEKSEIWRTQDERAIYVAHDTSGMTVVFCQCFLGGAWGERVSCCNQRWRYVSYRVVCRAMHGYIPREDVGLLLRYAYKYNSSICTERPVASTPRLTACWEQASSRRAPCNGLCTVNPAGNGSGCLCVVHCRVCSNRLLKKTHQRVALSSDSSLVTSRRVLSASEFTLRH